MNPIRLSRPSVRRGRAWVACLVALCLAGCATGSGGTRNPSTPYKGDATWNIASHRATVRIAAS